MLDRIDRSNAAMVEWAKDFDRRYPVRGWPRKGLDMVTYWMMFGLGMFEGEAWQTKTS